MSFVFDPTILNTAEQVQGIFERYVKNAGANCSVLTSLGTLIPKVDFGDGSALKEVSSIFSDFKDSTSSIIKTASDTITQIQNQIDEALLLSTTLNNIEEFLNGSDLGIVNEEFSNIQSGIITALGGITTSLSPITEAYSSLENTIGESLDMIRSINCPIINDAISYINPKISLYLSQMGDSIRNRSTIRDFVLKNTAGNAIKTIQGTINSGLSTIQNNTNILRNVKNSIGRIQEIVNRN